MMRISHCSDLSPVDALTNVVHQRSDRTGMAAPTLDSILRHYRPLAGRVAAKAECLRLIEGKGPEAVQQALAKLSSEWADHAIANVYAILMPHSRRKTLGAYFTPPHLVNHLLRRMTDLGLDIAHHRIRDPAAGGRRSSYRSRGAWLPDGRRKEFLTVVSVLCCADASSGWRSIKASPTLRTRCYDGCWLASGGSGREPFEISNLCGRQMHSPAVVREIQLTTKSEIRRTVAFLRENTRPCGDGSRISPRAA